MGWLDGRVALITGGASGLGAAVAERFIAEGARVAVLDKSPEKISELTAHLGNGVATTQGDVRELKDHQSAVAHTIAQFGKLDIFIGNAAIWDYGAKLVDLPEAAIGAAFDELFAVNVKGYLLGAKAVQRELVKSQGCMIFSVSNAGFFADGGGPLYTASKHAVVGLIRQLAFECAPHVRVNGVAPGAIPTDLRGPAALGQADRSIASVPLQEMVKGKMPIADFPSPGDYAGAYVLLASKENSRMATGSIINCDGGFAARGVATPSGGMNLPHKLGL